MAHNFLEEGPKFWDLDYNITATSNHVAKFRGNRQRKLRDFTLKKDIKHETQRSAGGAITCRVALTRERLIKMATRTGRQRSGPAAVSPQ